MSYPDYGQKTEDHQSMLILVRQIGQRTKARHYNRTYDKITKCACIRIQEPTQRFVWVRYKKDYPTDNNDWGDFQAHRKVLGLICVGRCDSEQELKALQRSYDYQCEQYASTLVDSRLLVIGVDKLGHVTRRRRTSTSGSGSESRDNTPTNSLPRAALNKGSPVKADTVMAPIEIQFDSNHTSLTVPGVLSNDGLTSSQSEDALTVQSGRLSSADSGVSLDVASVSSNEKLDRPLCERYEAPKSPNCWFYASTDDIVDMSDKMDDFVTSLFWVIEGKRRDRSFEKLDPLPLLTVPFEKKDLVGLDLEGRTHKKRCLGRLRKHLADLCLLSGLPGESIYHYQTALDTLKSANDWLWVGGCYEGLCSASVAIHYPRSQKLTSSFQRQYQSFSAKRGVNNKPGILMTSSNNGLDLAVDVLSKQCLAHDDIIDKYKEALQHYSKYRAANVVAMEASIKACRVLILQKKNLVAADFLQNVVYLNLQLSEEEKIQRYSTLAALYTQIGFHRKAAFFKRVAAMQCVAPSNARPAWSQCYNILLQTLSGYRIPLDPRKFPHDHTSGWPILQSRVLHELVFAARKMGNAGVAIRHMTFLLHCLLEHLSEQERKDISQVLENYTSKTEAQLTSIYLDNGITLPPVHLTKLPTVRSFKPLDLAPHLRPVLVRSSRDSVATNQSSPFIYSPHSINRNRKPRKTSQSTDNTLDFSWVEGNVCEVLLQVCNPMPYELKVTNMSLLTEGVMFESYPANLSLPAESGPYPVKIIGTPKVSGSLVLRGYSSVVLGIRTQCSLDDLSTMTEMCTSEYTVQVTPSLPLIQVMTSLPACSSFSSVGDSANVVTSATISMYAGQSQECEIILTNIGKDVITSVELLMDSRLGADILSRIFVWSDENLQSQLPLEHAQQASFTVYIHAIADFLPLEKAIFDDSGTYLNPTGRPRRTGHQADGDNNTDDIVLRTVEALLRVQYSGGAGGKAGYYRQCSVQFCVEIQSSLVFTRWDVLPSDSPGDCYLVLDLTNQTPYDVDVTYAQDHDIAIATKRTKRVAVRVGRCSVLPAPVAADTETSYSRYQQELLGLRYSNYLAQYLDIRWTISQTPSPISGKMYIDKLTWDTRQLHLLRTSGTHWQVLLDDVAYEPETVATCRVGEPMIVQVSVSNNADESWEDVCLNMTCSADHVTGRTMTSLADCVTFLACQSSPVRTIPVSESQTLQCPVLFLCSGKYKIQVACSSQPIAERGTSSTCYPIHIKAES